MKKRILFVINSLDIGGSEKSLVSLLNIIDYSKYEVDLLMFKKGAEFDIYIPNEVKVLDEPEYYKYLFNRHYKLSINKKTKYRITKLKTSLNLRINWFKKNSINDEQILYKNQKNVFERINKLYDIAIAYSQGLPTYFVEEKVNANKKIAWINCDYANSKYDKKIDEVFYEKFDKIVVVSQTIMKSIVEIKPNYRYKMEVILDIVNPKLIEKMAKEKVVFRDKMEIIILTVARLVIDYKGYDNAIKAAKLLKDNNYKFKWYVVGEGPDRKEIEKLIVENKLEDTFILLGKRENPYPYMLNCDIYVQPSKKEGFGLTVVEAKILEKPIVCTDFNTAKELIINGEDGLIVGQNEKDIYVGIKKYLQNDFRDKVQKELQNKEKYNTISEIEKFYKLIES